LEKQIIKISEDYSKAMVERQNQNESLIENSKNKHKVVIEAKNDELNNLKAELLGLKLEKEKYYSEYMLIKKEYEKLSSTFQEENGKYIKRFEESEVLSRYKYIIYYRKNQEKLSDKLSELSQKFDKTIFEKNLLDSELKESKINESKYVELVDKYKKTDAENNRIILKLKNNFENTQKEKETVEKEMERMKIIYETKIEQIKEQNELKIQVYENSLKYRQETSASTEEKAFEMIKRQESVKLQIINKIDNR